MPIFIVILLISTFIPVVTRFPQRISITITSWFKDFVLQKLYSVILGESRKRAPKALSFICLSLGASKCKPTIIVLVTSTAYGAIERYKKRLGSLCSIIDGKERPSSIFYGRGRNGRLDKKNKE